jgi:chromosomal replication initiator protein
MWFYDLIEPNAPKAAPSVLTIRDVVCKYFSILPKDVESSRRQGALVYPRQIAFYLARVHTACSYPQIGRRFGDRDHTTIMHGVKRIEERVKADWTVAYDIAHLEAML